MMVTSIAGYLFVTLTLQLTMQGSYGNDVQCYCGNNGGQKYQQQNQKQNQQYNQQPNQQQNQQQNQQSGQSYIPIPVPVPIPVPTHAPPQPANPPPYTNNNNNNNNNNNYPPKCNYCTREHCNPGSCKAANNFNAASDAERLQKAMKGLATDEDTLINILTSRSDDQIEMIRQEYVRCGRTLRSDIDGDTSFKTKDLLRALVTPRPLFYAEQLNKAFKDHDSDTMIEIFSSLSACAIREVSSEYEKTFHKSLPESIDKKTCGDFEDFLKELAKGNRDTNPTVDVEKAKKDADDLINSGVKKWFGTDEQKFIDVFAKRSWPQLREVLKQYDLKRSNGIDKDIDSETSGKLQKGLKTLVKNARDQPKYFADELDKSLDTLIMPVPGDNDKLIRIMRGRCGVDLGDIRDAYPKDHKGKKLADRLSSKTYMDYQAALLAMLKD